MFRSAVAPATGSVGLPSPDENARIVAERFQRRSQRRRAEAQGLPQSRFRPRTKFAPSFGADFLSKLLHELRPRSVNKMGQREPSRQPKTPTRKEGGKSIFGYVRNPGDLMVVR
jgi:hypothetical protein